MPQPPYNPDPPCCYIVNGFRPIYCNKSRVSGTDYCDTHQPYSWETKQVKDHMVKLK